MNTTLIPGEQSAPVSRISRISVGRLYNLGRYEHVRYEITLEVPEGGRAGDDLLKVLTLIHDLKPIFIDPWEEQKRRELVADPEKNGRHYVDLPAALESAKIWLRQLDERRQRRQQIFAAFNDLGGVEKYTDRSDDIPDDL